MTLGEKVISIEVFNLHPVFKQIILQLDLCEVEFNYRGLDVMIFHFEIQVPVSEIRLLSSCINLLPEVSEHEQLFQRCIHLGSFRQ